MIRLFPLILVLFSFSSCQREKAPEESVNIVLHTITGKAVNFFTANNIEGLRFNIIQQDELFSISIDTTTSGPGGDIDYSFNGYKSKKYLIKLIDPDGDWTLPAWVEPLFYPVIPGNNKVNFNLAQ